MVGDHAEADVVLVRGAVAPAAQLAGAVEHGPHLVGLVHVLDALLEERHALEPHARVDVLLREAAHDVELGLAADVVDPVLHEHEVPDLQVPRVVDRRAAIGAVGGAAVEEDLRVGAARARLARVPVVVRAAQSLDPRGGEPDDVAPDAVGLVVRLVDRDPEVLLVEAEAAVCRGGREQLPGVLDRAALEVVAERPVAEHLEERAVPRGPADLLDVVGPDALLHVGDPRMGRRDDAREVRDEGHHACHREHERWIIAHERRRRDDRVVLLLEVVEVELGDVGGLHGGGAVSLLVGRYGRRVSCPARHDTPR